jgi:predicted MFS family arabinose efflux permease
MHWPPLYGKWLRLSLKKTFSAGVEGYSTLLACAGIGATLSALWLAHGGARRSSPVIIMWAFLGFLFALIGFLQTESLAAAALAMIALGCCFEVCRIGTVALLQTSVLDELRGRVMSTQFLLMRLAGALGVYAIGATADARGLRIPMLGGVVFAFLVWCAIFRLRDQVVLAFVTPDSTH